MTIQVFKNPDEEFIKKWIEFDKKYNSYNIFQTPQMFELYKQTNKYTPVVLADINEHGDMESVFLFFLYKKGNDLVSLLLKKGTTVGLPVAKNDSCKTRLISQLTGYFSKPYHLIKIVLDDSSQKTFLDNLNPHFNYENHLNYIIDIDKSEDDIWKAISDKGRNKIKGAVKKGITLKTEDQISDPGAFYEIIKDTSLRASIETEDIDIFINAGKILSGTGNIKFFFACDKDKIVAYRMELLYKNYMYDWYAGNLTSHNSCYPNDFLVWEALKWGRENGYTAFNFGGAGSPNKAYGVRDFKKKFGGKLIDYGYMIDTNFLLKPFIKYLIRN